MQKTRITKPYLFNTFYLLTFLLTFGMSANAEDSSTGELMEEVVVTAMKREQNIMDAPAAVQNFAGDLVEELQLRDAFELADQIPGAYALNGSQPTVGEIFLRGGGVSDFQANGAAGDRTTGIYLDDTPMVYPNQQRLPPIPMFDLERVEVLRGPQGTTYGAGSMGGTLKYITRSPDLESFGGKFQITGSKTKGAHGNNRRVDAVLNIPIVPERFAVRIFLQDEHLSALADVQTRPEVTNADDFDSQIYRIKALWQVTDELSVEVARWQSDFEQWRFRGYPSINPIEFGNFADSFPRNDSTFEQSTMTIKWELPFATLTSNTQWIGKDQKLGPDKPNAEEFMTIGNLPITICMPESAPHPAGHPCILDLTSGNMVHGVSEEVRLVSNSDEPFQWLVGFQYMDMNQDGEEAWDLHGFIEAVFPDNQQVALLNTESKAVFGEASYAFQDGKVVALVGLRWYEDTRIQEEWFNNKIPVEYEYTYNEKTFDSVNPRFNVSYFPSEEGMAYINIAKGYRPGTAMRRNDVQNVTLAGIAGIDDAFADGDKVWSYELGSKWRFLDGRLIAQGAVYFSQWQDMQQQVGVSFELDGQQFENGSIAFNVGDADVLGIEWDLQYLLTDQVILGFNGAYTDSEWTGVVDHPAITHKPQIVNGNKVSLTPDWTLAGMATYRAPLMDTGWQLNLIGSAAWRSEPIDEQGRGPQAAFRRLNLRATVEKGPWAVQLFVQNATNFDRAFNPGSEVSAGGNILDPRTVGLTLRYAPE
tara:strand:+ start:278 stop:2554 length:2277 start_codon:yes stop_codon:yes gene_type:complete